jgi:predicted phosphodiesterase
MRIGLISDIHGNLVALDAILAELNRAGVDRIVCLGDVAVLGPQPAEVIDRVRERGIATVCGNTDAWLVADHPIPVEQPDSEASIALTQWTRSQIGSEGLAWLRSLPLTLDVSLETGGLMRCFHATPDSLDDITHAAHPAGVGEFSGAEIMCCGHTHVQAMWRVREQVWINPGSAGLPGIGPGVPGLPVNRNVSWAEFAVIESSDLGMSVTLRRLPIYLDALWASVQASGMPCQDWWRALWSS